MAFAFKDSDTATEFSNGTLPTGNTINVAIGDLCIVAVCCAHNDIFCDSMSDTAGNSYTVRTAILFGFNTVVFAWTVATSASAVNIFTAGFDDEVSNKRKSIDALVFTPDGGETVTFDVTASGGAGFEADPWETGQASTTGTDEVIVAAFQSGSVGHSNQEIPGGTAATVDVNDVQNMSVFYRIATGTIANCFAELTPSASQGYAAEFVSFKSVAGAVDEVGTLINKGLIDGGLVGGRLIG